MAAGEYTSVASQAELAMAEIELEKKEIKEDINREIEELMINILIEKLPDVGTNLETFNSQFGAFYPNPGSNVIALNCALKNENNAVPCEVYDIQGKLMQAFTVTPNAGKIHLNVNSLENGIYYCKFYNDGSFVTRKFVISK